MAPLPILLILGAGPRLGSAIASKFASQSFKVVLASRSSTDGTYFPEGHLHLNVDLSTPGSIPRVFSATKARLGGPPTIVVYNGAERLTNPPEDPFRLPLEDVKGPLAVGWETAYVAAQEAVKGFSEVAENEGSEVGKTFIFTGNALNQVPLPEVFAFAVAKRAAAAMVEYGANAYGRGKGYRFYYADQRDSKDGRPVGQDIDGEAHAEIYWQLARKGRQENWLVTFTKEQGRVAYGGVGWDGTPYKPIT